MEIDKILLACIIQFSTLGKTINSEQDCNFSSSVLLSLL